MSIRINQEKYFHQLRKNLETGFEIMKRKNHDYAGDSDPFKNFRAAEALGMSVEEGILVRMSDKLARAANLLKMKASDDIEGRDRKVSDESIEDTLIDLMNYSNILTAYLALKKWEIDRNRQAVFDGKSHSAGGFTPMQSVEVKKEAWMGDKINDDGSEKRVTSTCLVKGCQECERKY